MTTVTPHKTTLLAKHRLNGLNDTLVYPILIYETCRNADRVLPSIDYKHLTVGATWTDWLHEPWYDVRVATFERCLWPYDMPVTSAWKSINGTLLHYTPNLQTLVDPNDPSVVYFKIRNKIRVRMKFNGAESIEFIELVGNDVDC